MPIVTHNLGTIETPDNPDAPVKSANIDLALLLSDYYGKNIRQGHNFVVTGVQARLIPHNDDVNDDYDVGGSVAVSLGYVPTAKHSRRAWNQAFKIWTQQKKLSSTNGLHPTRNEDFEFAWDYAGKTSRTSSMRPSMGDDSAVEYACLIGDTTGSQDWCLKDFYNSTNRAPLPALNHYTGVEYKDNKYGDTKFPAVQTLFTTADASSIVTKFDSIGTNTYFSGGSMDAEFQMLPQPANVLCGVMDVLAWMIPGDTAAQIEDNMELYISFAISKWKPLVFRPRPRRSKKKFSRRKSSGRRFSRKRNRR